MNINAAVVSVTVETFAKLMSIFVNMAGTRVKTERNASIWEQITNAIANLMRRLHLEIQIVFGDLKIYQLRAVRI